MALEIFKKGIGHNSWWIYNKIILINDGVQDTLSQSMVPWHNEYLKLEEFEERAEVGSPPWPIPLTLLPWNRS